MGNSSISVNDDARKSPYML